MVIIFFWLAKNATVFVCISTRKTVWWRKWCVRLLLLFSFPERNFLRLIFCLSIWLCSSVLFMPTKRMSRRFRLCQASYYLHHYDKSHIVSFSNNAWSDVLYAKVIRVWITHYSKMVKTYLTMRKCAILTTIEINNQIFSSFFDFWFCKFILKKVEVYF